MAAGQYLSWALDTEASDVREAFLSGIHPLLVEDDLALCEKLERVVSTDVDTPLSNCEAGTIFRESGMFKKEFKKSGVFCILVLATY